jgi:hypothetical protein
MEDWVASVQTIEDARDFVLEVGMCSIFHPKDGGPNLWDAVDAPDKQPGESGWGEKTGKVWTWKNELPARYPDEIFYGKRQGGTAVLCTMDALREMYRRQRRPLEELSPTAQRLYAIIVQGPVNNAELKQLTGMTGKSGKSAYDRAVMELQVALQIVRVNRMDTEGDTWTPFEAQYPGFAP